MCGISEGQQAKYVQEENNRAGLSSKTLPPTTLQEAAEFNTGSGLENFARARLHRKTPEGILQSCRDFLRQIAGVTGYAHEKL